MKQPVVLKVYKGDKLEAVRQFENSQVVIGRNNDAQVRLEDEGVALLHAMIEDRDGEYYVSDLGSQTGTFRNGARVLEDKLSSGDQIGVGPYHIRFYIGVPKPTAPPKFNAEKAGGAAATAIAFTPAATETTDFESEEPPAPPAAEPPPKIPDSVPVIEPKAGGVIKREDKKHDKEKPADKQSAKKSAAQKPAGIPAAKKVHGKSAAKATGTFAPPSPYKDLKEVIKPHKGTVVEVVVAWRDRVLSTNHFKERGSVYISSAEDSDVIVPIISSHSKYELLKIGTQVTVCLTQEMTGELIRDGETVNFSELARQNKMRNVGTHFEVDLRQGEMIRVGLQGDLISIYVRYVGDTPKPLVAPLLDMTASEVTGLVLALAIAMVMAFYNYIYTPSPLLDDEARIDEPIRKAIVRFDPPHKVVEIKDEPPVEKPVAKATEKPKQSPKPTVAKNGSPGKAGEVAPKKTKDKQKKLTSARSGGAIKTSPKEGANVHSDKPDPTKVGLLGVFAKHGAQKDLDRAYSGSGELAGMADAATGSAGNAESRAGDNFGSKLKDTGAGGRGSQTIGISGVGTQGRGTGNTGYGSGGIGQKGSVQINVGGQEGEFTGGMDKEAIRRVIREHLREIRNCYERQLQRSPDLYGKLVLEWDIEEGGRVSRCVVKSNALGNDEVASCISNRLKTWKFPDPPKDMVGRVSYPFVFSSQ